MITTVASLCTQSLFNWCVCIPRYFTRFVHRMFSNHDQHLSSVAINIGETVSSAASGCSDYCFHRSRSLRAISSYSTSKKLLDSLLQDCSNLWYIDCWWRQRWRHGSFLKSGRKRWWTSCWRFWPQASTSSSSCNMWRPFPPSVYNTHQGTEIHRVISCVITEIQ